MKRPRASSLGGHNLFFFCQANKQLQKLQIDLFRFKIVASLHFGVSLFVVSFAVSCSFFLYQVAYTEHRQYTSYRKTERD